MPPNFWPPPITVVWLYAWRVPATNLFYQLRAAFLSLAPSSAKGYYATGHTDNSSIMYKIVYMTLIWMTINRNDCAYLPCNRWHLSMNCNTKQHCSLNACAMTVIFLSFSINMQVQLQDCIDLQNANSMPIITFPPYFYFRCM